MYNLEHVEVWEPSARGDQFRHLRVRSSRSWGLVGVEWIRVDDSELGELWKCGHRFWDWRRSVIVLTP